MTGMATTETVSKGFGRCRSCESVFVAEIHPDGHIRPIGLAADCQCGEGDFESLG